jgi:HD-GYP domain-containing protein (c-di-GMP phosphodiesterase class II)
VTKHPIQDYYAENLASVNKTNKVVTSDEIRNDQGTLLVSKGMEVSPQVAIRIAQHKLRQPIESSITIENLFDGNTVVNEFQKMASHPEIIHAMQQTNAAHRFFAECKKLNQYPLIQQKLTVLGVKYPELLKKTLFGAAIAVLIAQAKQLDEDRLSCIFIAAICRDFGLLHIDPNIVSSDTELSQSDWRLLQGHVAISFHFVRMIPNIPKTVPRLVLEHHESSDGFGYPRAKFAADLSTDGQIIALADTVIGLFYKHVFGHGYCVRALTPILQVNQTVHFVDNTMALLGVFHNYFEEMSLLRPIEEIASLVNTLLKRLPIMTSWFDIAVDFSQEILKNSAVIDSERTTNMLNRIQLLLVNSGISDNAQLNWLKEISGLQLDQAEAIEVEKFDLMLDEIFWQFKQLSRRFHNSIMDSKLKPEQLKGFKEKLMLLDKLWKAAY